MKKILYVFVVIILVLLSSCESRIRDININGTYKGGGGLGYEASVEKGTITIYTMSFFEKEIYWYGTCHADELDEENILVSERLDWQNNNGFFGFGSMGSASYAREKKIKFTNESLTFIYDFSGMSVSEVTLYKENTKSKRYENDSNAKQVPDTETYPYVAPSTDASEEEGGDGESESVIVPSDDNIYTL